MTGVPPNDAFYVTTSIPYVNAAPHLGFALEAVQADVFARHRRLRGDDVRLQSGTDDNSLKNVQAADAAGVPVTELVAGHADRFAALADPLRLCYDDFVRTSSDPRHRPGAERLWERSAAAGDLYREHYEGLYCVGCEQFYVAEELLDGHRCAIHGTETTEVREENWFFRLSRYQDELEAVLTDGTVRVHPEQRAGEVLGFVRGGLSDFSISRSSTRAHGWGIPVPGDPSQVMYVWWDALGNYLTGLRYAEESSPDVRKWWNASGRRVHVIGKDILRFHAVYWPAMLLSAGLPLPTDIVVHDFLTVDGAKLSKSVGGSSHDPFELANAFGADALRWWLCSEVVRVGETDFTEERLIRRADDDLASGVGNLVRRLGTMVRRYRGGTVPTRLSGAGSGACSGGGLVGGDEERLRNVVDALPGRIDEALARFDPRAATTAIREVVAETNRYLEVAQPWKLADPAGDRREHTGPDAGVRLDVVLETAVDAVRRIGHELSPFVPDLAARVAEALGANAGAGGQLPDVGPVQARLGSRTSSAENTG